MNGQIIGILGLIAGLAAVLVGAVVGFLYAGIVFGAIMTAVAVLYVVIVWFFWLGPTLEHNRLTRDGVPARGTILEVHDTGTSVNKDPLVKLLIEVRLPDTAPYKVQSRTVISRLNVAHFTPGTPVGLRVDPKNQKKVIIESVGDASAATPGGVPQQIQELLAAAAQRNRRILDTGEAAAAIILECLPLNVHVDGDNPAMEFRLKVLPANDAPFEARATAVIMQESASRYQPGSEIDVKFDPNDREHAAIVSRPPPG